MAVTNFQIPKIHWMAASKVSEIVINKGTAISLSLALAIAAFYGLTEVRHANNLSFQEQQTREITLLRSEIKEIENSYVSKEQLNSTMQLIQLELKAINEKISK